MLQRVKRLTSGPMRIAMFATIAFFVTGSALLLVTGLTNGNGTDTTNGAIGVLLFAFLGAGTARALERVDEAERDHRSRKQSGPPVRRALRDYPRVVTDTLNTPGRRYIGTVIGFFLAIGVVGLVYGVATLNPRALVALPIIGLFTMLMVTAVGAFRLADERAERTK